jgi:filamentous hemagglutinin family protein
MNNSNEKLAGQFRISDSGGLKDFFGTILMMAGLCGIPQGVHAGPIAVDALPSGAQIIQGNVSLQQSGSLMNVNSSSAKSIVNFQSFNVGSQSKVNFNLPDANSAILNRVVGGSPSQIFGQINSNGNVFLVNPSGILFGKTASINVNSLFASTLSITDQDFMNGDYVFSQSSQPSSIVNEGSINAQGSVVLMGGAVKNSGTVNALNGSVKMLVGETVRMTSSDGVSFDVVIDKALSEKVQDFNTALLNTGSIKANLVELRAELENSFYDRAVNNSGVIEAMAISGQGGEITLLASSDNGRSVIENTGKLSANSNDGSGGKINIFSDEINILKGSEIEASGSLAGGEILLGGDYLGKTNPLGAANAKQVFVEDGVSIKADAKLSGDGGKVIVWSDGITVFDGFISAQGGQNGGDGGFVETSGKEFLFLGQNSKVNTKGVNFGTWLLDPLNITISDTGTDTPTLAQLSNPLNFASYSISPLWLDSQATNINLFALNNINFNSALNLTTPGVGLTATAGNNINVNAAISTQGGTIDLNTNVGSININNSVSSNGGVIDLNASGLLGTVNVNGVVDTLNGNFVSSSAIFNVGAAGTINAGTADASVVANSISLAPSANSIQADNITVAPRTNNRTVNIGGTSTDGLFNLGFSAAELNSLNAANTLTIGSQTNTGTFNVAGATVLTGTADVVINNLNQVNFLNGSSFTVTNDLDVNSNRFNVSGTGQIFSTGGTVTISPVTSRDINVGGTVADTASLLSVSGAELSAITAPNIVIGNAALTGDISLGGSIDRTLNPANLTLVTDGDIDLNTFSITLPTNTLSLNAAGTGNSINIDAVVLAQNVNLTGDRMIIDTTLPGFGVTGTNSVTIAPSTERPVEIAGTFDDTLAGAGTLSITLPELLEIDTDNLTIGNRNLGQGLVVGADIIGDFNLTLQNRDSITVPFNIDLTNTDASPTDNAIQLFSNQIDINPNIQIIAPRRATLAQATAGNNIDLGVGGTVRPTWLNITDAELDTITSNVIQVGQLNNTGNNANTGEIQVTQRIDLENSPTLSLQAGGTITDVRQGRIIEDNLAVRGASAVTLDSVNNDVNNFAATLSNGGLTFVDADDLTVSTVDGVVGATTSAGPISLQSLSTGSEDDPIIVNDIINARGSITLTADNIDINATVTAGSRTNLVQSQAGTLIDVGGADSAGVLGLTSDEINLITAGVIQIGNANSGNIDITANIAPTGTNTLALRSGGTITQSGGTVTETNLAIRSVGDVDLTANNDVNNLSAEVTGNGSTFTFVDIDDLAIRNVDGRNGMATNNGNIDVETLNGNLVVFNTGAANDITSGTGTIDLTAGGLNNLFDLRTGAVIAANNDVTITSDRMNLAGSINASGQRVTLQQFTDGRVITLGATTPGLGITDAMLDRITAETIQVGNFQSGDLTVAGPITLATADNLSIVSGGNITQTTSLSVNNLASQALGDVNLSNASNDVTNFAATGTTVTYVDANSFSVEQVDGVNGVSSTLGDVSLTATGSAIQTNGITVNSSIVSADDVFINADNLDVNASISAPSLVHIQPSTNGVLIDLGSDDVAGAIGVRTLGLTSPELDLITAGTLRIGNLNSGDLTISSDVAPLGTGILSLLSGGNVTQTGSISESNLSINALGDIDLTNNSNNVNVFAANASSVLYTDADSFTVGTVDGVVGVTAFAGDITLTSISSPVDAEQIVINNAVTSNFGSVNIVTDNIDINASVIAQDVVHIQPFSPGVLIDLGGSDQIGEIGTRTLGLDNNELNSIQADVLRVGNLDSGDINVSTDIAPTGTDTLTMLSGGNVAQVGAIVEDNLAVIASGVILQNPQNDVNHFSAVAFGDGQPLSFTDANDLTIATVDFVTGLISNDGHIDVKTIDGDLTVSAPSFVFAGNGLIDLTAGGFDNLLDIELGTLIINDNVITLTADNMNLNGIVFTPNSTVNIFQFTDGRDITLGTIVPGTLSLTNIMLDNIFADTIQIGNELSGDINITSLISPMNAPTLSLTTGGSSVIQQTIGSPVIVDNLVLSSQAGMIDLAANNDVETLIIQTNGANATFRADDDFEILGINLNSDGVGGFGNLTLMSAFGDVTQSREIFANGMNLLSNTATFKFDLNNDINILSASSLNGEGAVAPQIIFSDTDGLSLVNINIVDGSLLTNSDSSGAPRDFNNFASSGTALFGVIDGNNLDINSFAGNIDLFTNVTGSQVALDTYNGGNIILRDFDITADNSIVIRSSNEVIGLSVNQYPKLTAPNIIVEGNKVADFRAPIAFSSTMTSGYILDRSNQTGLNNALGLFTLDLIKNFLVIDSNGFSLYPSVPLVVNNGLFFPIYSADGNTPVIAKAIEKPSSDGPKGAFFKTTAGTFVAYGEDEESSEKQLAELEDFTKATGKTTIPAKALSDEANLTDSLVKTVGALVELPKKEFQEYTIYTGTVLPVDFADPNIATNNSRNIEYMDEYTIKNLQP